MVGLRGEWGLNLHRFIGHNIPSMALYRPRKYYLRITNLKQYYQMGTIKLKLVFDRHKRANANKKGSVELRMTEGKRQKYVRTGVEVYPKNWDERTTSVKNSADAAAMNAILISYHTRASKLYARMVESGEGDVDSLQRAMRKESLPKMSFVEYVRMRAQRKYVKEGTRKHFEAFARFLERWGGISEFEDITEAKVRDMDEWLHSKGMKTSTVFGYHKHLKQFINDAIIDGYLTENVYSSRRIKIDRGEKENVDSLTEEQLRMVESLELESPCLERVKDLFLFQCYTGLAYTDMMELNIDDFKKDSDGRLYHVGNREKTGSAYSLMLLAPAIDIWEKYNWELPRITNQKYNLFLKVIGTAIGVPNLHSHMGRGTFASFALNHGVSIDVLQKMVGHKQRSQTQRYAKMWNETIKENFMKLESDLTTKR